jgi:carbon storage regulator CsrA
LLNDDEVRRKGFFMLVLGRRKGESVVIGDEITVIAENVLSNDDGHPLHGATVRLGFDSPRYVSICRGELYARSRGIGHGMNRPKRVQQPGRLVEIADAHVQLQIEVPRKIPVCHNGTPLAHPGSNESPDGQTVAPTVIYHVTCHKEDRITICNNITLAMLGIYRFVFAESRDLVHGISTA